MIHAIRQMGQLVPEKAFLKSLVRVNDKIEKIVKVNFDTKEQKVTFEEEEADQEKLIKYLWIGHFVSGSRSDKIYLVTNSFNNILNKKEPHKTIINQFPSTYKELSEKIKSIQNIPIPEYQGNNTLYCLSIDNEILCLREDYSRLILKEMIEKHFKEKQNTVCSFCGKSVDKVANKIYVFKFFNTDKPGFSSQLKNWEKSFSICEECLKDSFRGKAFIENYLKTRIGSLPLLIIPEFAEMPGIHLNHFSNLIKNIFNPGAVIGSIESFENRLRQFIKFKCRNQLNTFSLNYLFYKGEEGKSKQFKVNKLIKDVLPSRIQSIIEAQNQINKDFQSAFSFKPVSLNMLYYLIPIKLKKKKAVGSKYYLNLLEAVIKKHPVSEKELIHHFVKAISAIYFKREGQFSTGSRFKDALQSYLMTANFTLLFLYRTQNIKKGGCMTPEIKKVLDMLKEKADFMKEKFKDKNPAENTTVQKYEKLHQFFDGLKETLNNQKAALILLGFLVSEVARKQKSGGLKNKPILKKIQFDGMKIKEIIQFCNVISEKLIAYKIADYNDFIQYLFQELFLKEQENWVLSSSENVFYLLSGYAAGNVFLKSKKEEVEEIAEIDNSDDDSEEDEENNEEN